MSAPVGEQDEHADEVEAVDGQWKGLGVDAVFSGAFGEQKHVLVGDTRGEAGQSGDGDDGDGPGRVVSQRIVVRAAHGVPGEGFGRWAPVALRPLAEGNGRARMRRVGQG
ncbi:MAG TPA: hypothetical protein VGJ07_17955 [Rugosimonospora sp.]|jgi:hypothetical protein